MALRNILVHRCAVRCVFVVSGSHFVLSAGDGGLCYATDLRSGKQRWRGDLSIFKSSSCKPACVFVLKDWRVALTVQDMGIDMNGPAIDIENVE